MLSKEKFFGIGIRSRSRKKNESKTLEVQYLWLSRFNDDYAQLKEIISDHSIFPLSSPLSFINRVSEPLKAILSQLPNLTHRYLERDLICFQLHEHDQEVKSVEEGYFKLQLISHRQVLPHETNLSGLFGILENLAWTNYGPILVEDVPAEKLKRINAEIPLTITHVDKFPYLINYHIPSGVRIADGSRVRLGAYLGEGSTVMPAGYVNFNAGSLGKAMRKNEL